MNGGCTQTPLQRILRLKSGDFISVDQIEPDGPYPVYGGNGLRGFTDRWNTEGPIVLIGRQGAHCGNVHIARTRCWVSEHALRCIPNKAYSTDFIRYALETLDLNRYSVSAAQPGLSTDNIKPLPIAFPPLEIQRQIAAFLDKKTAQIDALVEKKRALLDRLAEKRQAIITQAVTKGLNPAAPMKDSGIDWLGRVPAHWEVKRLKFVAARPLQYGANASADWDEPNWPRFIRITDVDPDGALRPETFRSLPPEIGSRYLLSDGDILLARSGATVGKSFLYRPDWGNACFAGYLIQARIGSDHDAEFVYDYLNSHVFWSWASANFIQSTIQNISAEKYSNIWVPCPPIDEQVKIVGHISSEVQQMSAQVDLIQHSVVSLDEYRSALITAAVTGRIEGLR